MILYNTMALHYYYVLWYLHSTPRYFKELNSINILFVLYYHYYYFAFGELE